MRILIGLLAAGLCAQTVVINPPGGGGGGGAPTGAAGGGLGGTYPNPTVKQISETVTSVNFAASPYTVVAADSYIYCDATAGAVVINLPATSGSGREITIKKTDATANTCTPTRAGSDVIDGGTSVPLTGQYVAAKLIDRAAGTWDRTHINQLSGDVSGSSSANVVSKIGGKSVTLGGALTTSGAFPTTLTTTAATSLTLPVAGTLQTNGPVIINPLNYGVKADGHYIKNASTTNGSNIVTCPTSACNFLTTASVGQTVFAGISLFGGALAMPETTIQSVDSDTQIHTVANALSTQTGTALLAWGSIDENATSGPYMNAWNAFGVALQSGAAVFQIPCGISLVKGGISFNPSISPGTEPTIQGCGPNSSILIPTPSFAFSTGCDTSNFCFFAGILAANAQGQITLRDFEIFGVGNALPASCPASGRWYGTGVYANALIYNVFVNSWCSNTATFTGMWIGTPGTAINAQVDAAGQPAMLVNTGPTQPVNLYWAFAGDSGQGLLVNGSGVLNSYGGSYTSTSCAQAIAMGTTAGFVFNSYGELIQQGLNVPANNSVANLSGDSITSANCAANGPLYSFGAGNTFNILNGTVITPSGTTQYDTAGTTTVNVDSTSILNLGTLGTLSAGVTLIASGRTFSGACTGVASSSSTLGLYGTGPNVTATTCTSTTIGSGQVMMTTGKLKSLFVKSTVGGFNSSSGVVTALKNGIATTMTCTIGTATSCIDTLHTVSYVAGDLVSLKFTTQATETLAGVTAVVQN